MVVFDLIKKGETTLDEKLIISENAWRLSKSGYSSMFVMLNDEVSVENLLKTTAGLEIPETTLDSHFPDNGEFSVIGLEKFSEFYIQEKNYLKLPFAVASVLVNHVLEIPEIAKLPQEKLPQKN